MSIRRVVVFFTAAALCLAQQPVGEVTFSSSTQLVVETVTVRDKSGKPIEGLTAKDFTVTEKNAAQEIRFFE